MDVSQACRRGLEGADLRAAELDLDMMVPPVVGQRDAAVGLFDAVAHDAAEAAPEVRDLEVIDRLAMAVVHRQLAPARRQARLDPQLVDLEPDAEQRLGDELVHPAGPAGGPGPAAPPGGLG